MTELETICKYALFPEIRAFDDARSLVMDPSTEQLYYKKRLTVYNPAVFAWLKDHPHPNVPAVYAFWEQDGELVVIEEYIAGQTLEDLLEEGNLSFAEKKRILLTVCGVLTHLHHAEPPIIHRDVKASNVMVTGDGVVKLIDYDAAKVYVREAGRDTVLIGTQGIAAPEQYGFAASDERTDIYALGKLTERLFPDEAAPIVEKATRMDPRDRYESVAQMHARLERLKEGRGRRPAEKTDKEGGGQPEAAEDQKRKPEGRRIRRRLLIAGLALLIAAAGAGLWYRTVWYPENRVRRPAYEAGAAAMQSGDYEEALRQFDVCGTDYRDAAEKAAACGMALEREKAAKAAAERFEKERTRAAAEDALKALKDLEAGGQPADGGTADLLREIREAAETLLAEDDCGGAEELAALLIAEGADGAEALLQKIRYHRAELASAGGDHAAAVTQFAALGDYLDAADRADEARFRYCEAAAEAPDALVYEYLEELVRAGRPGAADLQQRMYRWRAQVSLTEDEPMGDMQGMRVEAVLSGGAPGAGTTVRFEIDTAAGEHLSFTTDGVYHAGETACALFAVPAETQDDAADHKGAVYTAEAYAGDGTLMGRIEAEAGEKAGG